MRLAMGDDRRAGMGHHSGREVIERRQPLDHGVGVGRQVAPCPFGEWATLPWLADCAQGSFKSGSVRQFQWSAGRV
jgi:hypothetical protein